MLSRGDIIIMCLLLTILVNDKKFKLAELMTEDERQRFEKVLKKNEYDDDLENVVLTELLNDYLLKAGIRFGALPEYIH